MQVSRQLYEEGHHLLWTTNAFVLSDAHSLAAFILKLNKVQRQKLALLHILSHICIPEDELSEDRPYKTIDLKTSESIHEIKYLHVDVHCHQVSTYYHRTAGELVDLAQKSLFQLRNINGLRTGKAMVSLSDESTKYRKVTRLTAFQCNMLAGEF